MPTLDDPRELRRRITAAPVARPITFALVDDLICFVVDEVKPKRDMRLARLADIARDDRVALLVDHYDANWSALWWVRVDGRAVEHAMGPLRDRAVDALAAKYPPYRTRRPTGSVVAITPVQWAGWSAS